MRKRCLIKHIEEALFLFAEQIDDLSVNANLHTYVHPKLQIRHHKLLESVPDFYVRIRPEIVGICGSDMHMTQKNPHNGQIVSSVPMSIPLTGRILGHEGLCQVTKVGEGVTEFAAGDWVVPSSIYHCGSCQVCMEGAPNQCANSRLLGSQIDGLFATEIDVHKNLLFNVSPFALDPDSKLILSALEPLATALQAILTSHRNNTKHLLILGAGPIGAFAALIAKYFYLYETIVVIEPIQKRRELVEEFCSAVFPSVAELLTSIFKDIAFHSVVEACGDLTPIDEILKLMHPRGVMTLMGRAGQPLHLKNVDTLITNAIQIQGCRGQLGGYMEKAANIISANRMPFLKLLHLEHGGLPRLKELLTKSETLSLNYCKLSITL